MPTQNVIPGSAADTDNPAADRALPIPEYTVRSSDYADFMRDVQTGTVDLVLTDPPYSISRKTGFNVVGPRSVERFAVSMDFGAWDHEEIDLKTLCAECQRALRRGGTLIVFYDLWKITTLADAMSDSGFSQLRLIIWDKTNPVPLNSKCNYLTNSREIAVLGVKGGKSTFHGEYDNGVYSFPIPRRRGGRLHPTQKPLKLFRELIEKHSNAGDIVIDPFLGSGTTAIAALELGRRFAGCDIDRQYVDVSLRRIQSFKSGMQRGSA